MRTCLVIVFAACMACAASSQTLNNEGLYVNADGTLFSGRMTKMQHESKVELAVLNGKAEGEAWYYYPGGKLMESGQFHEGEKHGKWVRYSENGSLSAIAFYNLGKKTGTWVVYDDKGNKRFEMNYADGEKTGLWTTWDERGQVADTRDYGKIN